MTVIVYKTPNKNYIIRSKFVQNNLYIPPVLLREIQIVAQEFFKITKFLKIDDHFASLTFNKVSILLDYATNFPIIESSNKILFVRRNNECFFKKIKPFFFCWIKFYWSSESKKIKYFTVYQRIKNLKERKTWDLDKNN